MRDAPQKLFMLVLALAKVWSAIHFVSTKGLPPTRVHALEQGLDSAHRSPNEFTLGPTDLSVLLRSPA
jgi:hypothetical protein